MRACPLGGARRKKHLSERIHHCDACGHGKSRDGASARYMLALGYGRIVPPRRVPAGRKRVPGACNGATVFVSNTDSQHAASSAFAPSRLMNKAGRIARFPPSIGFCSHSALYEVQMVQFIKQRS
jgi:hypothetical protein